VARPSSQHTRILFEQVRILYQRASIAQATVVVNAAVIVWVFWGRVPHARAAGWLVAVWTLAALRLLVVQAYRRRVVATSALPWARLFTAGAVFTGLCWGAAVLVFYAPESPAHQVFLAFVLGGMTAGAASSNCSFMPAFVGFTLPTLVPMVIRLAAEGDRVHGAMAFMLILFGVAVGGIARTGGRTLEKALRLRFRNEALVEDLTTAQARLEGANAGLERRVQERTAELERSERQLRQSDQQKSRFIALLSHELRNPLAPIRSGVYVLEHAPRGSPACSRALDAIRRQTDHLARLVDDLLDVTRISEGKLELRRGRVDLGAVVHRASDDFREAFQARGIALRVEDSSPVWLDADETRIAQVVGNLLHNAVKFGRRDGSVVVRTGVVDGQAELRVRDDGAGIAPEVVPQLFQPFVQADGGGLARTAGGLGLGLALVKRLVELHGGRVRALSEGVGRGAEFVVTLPVATAAAAEVPAPAPAAATATPAATDVLVIEDNMDAARSIADVLTMEGHRVSVATDGRTGIAKARDLRPDIILCDIGLPDVDGYDVVRTLRADGRLAATRFVALSGYAQPEDRARASEAGFDLHLAKPAPVEALLALVASSARR
jgi:signal transduction histidine kinase/CheY-like chemotaxis protein